MDQLVLDCKKCNIMWMALDHGEDCPMCSLRAEKDRIVQQAVSMISNGCKKHTQAVLNMGFSEFYEKNPTECDWCMRDRLIQLTAKLRLSEHKRTCNACYWHSVDCDVAIELRKQVEGG